MPADEQEVDVLGFIPDEDRESVLEMFREVEFTKEKIIFFQGEPSEYLYIVRRGTIEESNMHADGRVYIHEFLSSGDVFGEGLVYQQEMYPYTAQAREDSTALRAGRDAIRKLVLENESFRNQMVRVLGRKVDLAYSKFKCIAGEKVDRRITCVLMRYMNMRGIDEACGMIIDTPLKNRDIAGLIGSTEETVSRVMSKLKKNDVITTDNGYIVVKDRGALAEFFDGL